MAKNRFPRFTPEHIEQMTAHELADFLANIVLVLRRMPNVPLAEMKPVERPFKPEEIVENVRHEHTAGESKDLPDWVS